jgi:hypothetical protein
MKPGTKVWYGPIYTLDGVEIITPRCADCNFPIGYDNGPVDGWQLEDGRTVCQRCCVADTVQSIQVGPQRAATASLRIGVSLGEGKATVEELRGGETL